jgi:hypothetical protein
MRFTITGATSPIGILLTSELTELGHEVKEIGRNSNIKWSLGQRIPLCAQSDVLIHLAYDRSKSLEQNLSDIRIICESFKGFLILLSSTSAHSRSKSIYGKSKYSAENIFVDYQGAVIKSGLICGSVENRFLTEISRILNKYRLILLPYSGHSRLFLSRASDLVSEIIHISLVKKKGVTRGFCLLPVSFNQLVRNIPTNYKFRIIKIPTVILSDFLIKSLKLLLPKNRTVDSLMSLVCEIDYQDLILMQAPKNKFCKPN